MISMEEQRTEFDVGGDISDRGTMNRDSEENKHDGCSWTKEQSSLVVA